MFCSNCGNTIEEGSLFCPYCGAKLSAPSVEPKKATGINKVLLTVAIISGAAVITAAGIGIYAITHKEPVDSPEHTSKGIVASTEVTTERSSNSQKDSSETPVVFSIDNVLDAYQNQVTADNGHNVALIDFDGDETPELVYTANYEYKLYTYKNDAVSEITISPGNTLASLYGNKFYNGSIQAASGEYEYFLFEYVPGEKLIRTHSSNTCKNDYYLTFDENLSPTLYLQSSWSGKWTTYINGSPVENEEFNKQRVDKGFDKLVKCEYYYDDVKTAYKNMDKKPAKSQLFTDFITGNTDAINSIYYVGENTNDYSCNLVSYEDYLSIIGDSNARVDYQYIDFDNDGIDELLVYGECYSISFFDTFGDNVYLLFSSEGTADMAEVHTNKSGNQIIRCDICHGGRQIFDVSTYDACGCLVDWFELSAEYYGNSNDTYDANSSFNYRGRKISMAEYEMIYKSLYDIGDTD